MATWAKITGASVAATCVQAANEAAPTNPADGIPLISLFAISLTIQLDSGQTFTAATGQLDFYFYDENVGAWSYMPGQSIGISPDVVGRNQFSVVVPAGNCRGRGAYIDNNLQISGGSVTHFYSPTTLWWTPQLV